MSQQQGSGKGGEHHPIVILGFIVIIFMIFYWILSNNARFYSEYYFQWMKKQANFYSKIVPSYYGEESDILNQIDEKLQLKLKQNTIEQINLNKLKQTVDIYSVKTRDTTFFIVMFFGFLATIIVSLNSIKHNKMLMNQNENIAIKSGGGVEGVKKTVMTFLLMGKKAKEQEEIKKQFQPLLDSIDDNTPPEQIKEVFDYIRQTKNIPNNLVGRAYPSLSDKRLALLEVGKCKVYNRTVLGLGEKTKTKEEIITEMVNKE